MGRGRPTWRAALAAVAVLVAGVSFDHHPAAAGHSDRIVALSFDDGPSPRYTSTVLDLLARYHAHATFFDEGQNAALWPELVRRTVAEGNEVANHTFSHPDVRRLDTAAVTDEVDEATAAIRAAGVEPARWFRPPKGFFDDTAATAVEAAGYHTVMWDLCLEHFLTDHTEDEAVTEMLARVHPGAVLLAHDGGIPNRRRTVESLPALLAGLRTKGYEVVTVTELRHRAG